MVCCAASPPFHLVGISGSSLSFAFGAFAPCDHPGASEAPSSPRRDPVVGPVVWRIHMCRFACVQN